MLTDTHDTKTYYDATAEQVADEWYPNDVLMPTIHEFLSHLPPTPRVLDLGCGPGHESMRLASAGASVLGLDLSDECIRVARERCPQCQFAVGDFRDLDMRFGTFQGVFAAASIIHVCPQELAALMGRIANILDGRGRLLAIVQDGDGSREHWPVIDGRKLKRTIYLYDQESLASATTHLEPLGELSLADELVQRHWRAHLFGRAGRVDR
jgi:trans-aconitate methyltransferase